MVSDSSLSLRGTLCFEERHNLIQRVVRMHSEMSFGPFFLELHAQTLGEDEPDRTWDFSLSHLENLSLEELHRLEERLIQAQHERIRLLVEASRRLLRESEERFERLPREQLAFEEQRLADEGYLVATEQRRFMWEEQRLVVEERRLAREKHHLATEDQHRLVLIRQRQLDLQHSARLLREARHDWVRVIERDRLLEERHRYSHPVKNSRFALQDTTRAFINRANKIGK